MRPALLRSSARVSESPGRKLLVDTGMAAAPAGWSSARSRTAVPIPVLTGAVLSVKLP